MLFRELIFRGRGSGATLKHHDFKVDSMSQEQLKLRTANLASTFTGSIRTQAHEKFWRNRSVGVSRDCPNFLCTAIISGKCKATNFKFSRYIHRVRADKRPFKLSVCLSVSLCLSIKTPVCHVICRHQPSDR